MAPSRVLIACVGNIFLGDDAFGVEVAKKLAAVALPEGVRVVDFGIRGLDLTYALLDGHGAVILVDATPRGGPPGTLYVIEPTPGEVDANAGASLETHGMDPVKVLRAASAMGGSVGRVRVVGCEPSPVDDPEEFRPGLSDPVRAAVDEAVPLILSVAEGLLSGEAPGVCGGDTNPGKTEVGSWRT